jgi:hypothetical protein
MSVQWRECQLFIDFKKTYDSVMRAALYNILIKFGIPMKLVRLLEICLNEACSKVRRVKVGRIIFLLRMS